MSNKQGVMIVLEGVDGAGKSVQAARLHDKLRQFGVKAHLVREPGTTPLGAKVRSILLDSDISMAREAEAMLFMASRIELIAKITGPALKADEVVIYDRFIESTLGYQVHAGGGLALDYEEVIAAVLNEYIGYGWHRLPIILDVDPTTAVLRRDGTDRMEANYTLTNFQSRLFEFYATDVDHVFCEADRRWREWEVKHVDGNRTEIEVHKDIVAACEPVLREARQWPSMGR
jgi:dTMP kinase